MNKMNKIIMIAGLFSAISTPVSAKEVFHCDSYHGSYSSSQTCGWTTTQELDKRQKAQDKRLIGIVAIIGVVVLLTQKDTATKYLKEKDNNSVNTDFEFRLIDKHTTEAKLIFKF